MKKIYNKQSYLGMRAFYILALVGMTFASRAQITIDTQPSTAETHYVGQDSVVQFTSATTYVSDTIFYLHTGSTLTADSRLASVSTDASDFNFTWPEAGFTSLTITPAAGAFETTLGSSDLDPVGGSLISGTYEMNQAGPRSLTSDPFDTRMAAGSARLFVSFNDANVVASRPIQVQYSTNGSSFSLMSSTTFQSSWSGGGARSLEFDIPVYDETTYIRIIQQNSDDLTVGVEPWTIDANVRVEFPRLREDDPNDVSLGFYTIASPSITISPSTSTFTVGEQDTIDYTTDGPFPSNTEFALLLKGPDNRVSVIAQSTSQVSGEFVFTIPDFSKEDYGTGSDLYNQLTAVAFNSSTNANYVADETIVLDDDSQFIVIEGTNGDDGDYIFDFAGDRSLLTQAFDLSGATGATFNFYFQDYGIASSDNIQTIPRFQVSTDGGASFTNVAVEETGLLGDGYLFNNNNYSATIPSGMLTAATHFRFYQPLNMGVNQDDWRVRSMSLTIEKNNEIDAVYSVGGTIGASVNHPAISNYSWEQLNADTDAIFSGETFEFNWNKTLETTLDYPSGTSFSFILHDGSDFVIDHATGRPFVIATTAVFANNISAEVPFYVEEGTYSVRVIASKTNGGDTYYYHGDLSGESTSTVGSIDVFIRAVKTTIVGDENETIYAGSTVEFAIDIENDETNTFATSGLFATLLAKNVSGSNDLILATQSGIGNITVDLPPYLRGTETFEVFLSQNAALGSVGDRANFDGNSDFTLSTDDYVGGSNYAESFSQSSGRGTITTRDFTVGELSGYSRMSFDLSFGDVLSNITNDEVLILEYSVDDGATYVSIDTLPSQDIYDELFAGDESNLAGESFSYEVLDLFKTSEVRFRFRQEERGGISVNISNVKFSAAEVLPFDYVAASVSVANQALIINSFSATEICGEAQFDINYEIRGRFGADNIVIPYYRRGFSIGSISGYEFSLTEGSGSISLQLPSSLLDDDDDNMELQFRLYANDDTYEDINEDFTQFGSYSEVSIEAVVPIQQDAEFSFSDPLTCESEATIVTISDVQNYFTYEIRNAADDAVLGSLTYDPEVGDNEVNIGILSSNTDLEMVITSKSSSGTVCNSLVSTYKETLEVLPNFQLYRRSVSNAGHRILVQAGDSAIICEGTTGTVRLSVNRLLESGVTGDQTSGVEWFRDDLSNPVTISGSVLGDNEVLEEGSYFARVTTGSCVYTTESFLVNVSDNAERPEVTVVSGDLRFCEGDGEVVLEAPAGFRYYLWSTGEGTRSITVEDGGSYSVQVSDVSFDVGCGSPSSIPVVVEEISSPDFYVMNTTFYDEDNIIDEGSIVEFCDEGSLYFFENTSWANNGTVIIYSVDTDGTRTEYASTTANSYLFRESGTYSVDRFSSDVNATCVESTGDFTVTINEIPDSIPQLSVSGDLSFCATEGEATLTAPAGFAYYQWYFNGNTINSNTSGFGNSSNTLSVREGGIYSVKVGNASGCYGRISNTVTITTKALPSIPTAVVQVDATCGSGVVRFVINNNVNRTYNYQLINAETGQASGAVVRGISNGNTYIVSDAIDEETPFYLEVSYADGSGCVAFDEFRTFVGRPNNVHLEMVGVELEAVISNFSGYDEIRWYRNEVELVHYRGNRFITVLDAAQYAVEVDFEGVGGTCTVTSNAIDLASAPTTNRTVSNGRIAVSTYPNPSASMVNIELGGEKLGAYEINIMSLSGKVLISDTVDKDAVDFTHQLSIENLDPGIYNMKVQIGKEFKNLRILKR